MSGLLLFGGSFDPVHHGHLIVARSAAEMLGVQRVVLIPSASPPHKRDVRLTPAELRVQMCRLAVEGDGLFAVSDWETHQPGPNYTLLTVRHFAEQWPNERLYWLIGMDSLRELHTWYKVGELAEACTLVTVGRPGSPRPDRARLESFLSPRQAERIEQHILESPLIEISATDVRARVAAGKDIRYLVPDRVRNFISEKGLYR